ncbi:HAMP domain-containing protein [Paenibacillus zeirhizosphaerae]|uniref:HAMP domain-containing protein n=1 Tax=Paenibacillus zeirhizosphaerae TaxID=2987519 RepID=UPI0035222861
MLKWSTLSFFNKNLLLSFMNIILIGTALISSSYFNQRSILTDQLHNQIERTTAEWYKGLDSELVRKAVEERSYNGPTQTRLRAYLDAVSKHNPNIKYAYIFGTELGGINRLDTSIVAMPTSLRKEFGQNWKLRVGDMYQQPPEVAVALGKMLDTGQPGFTDIYKDDFGEFTTIIYPIMDETNKKFAYFAVDADASAIHAGLQKLLIHDLLTLAGFLVICLLLQYLVVKGTLAPIKALISGIEEVSQGRLDIRIQAGSDDLGQVNESFNHMVCKINDIMVKVKHTTDAVSNSAKDLLAICELNSSNANIIDLNVNEIAENIRMQAKATTVSTLSMSEVAAVLQSVSECSTTLAKETELLRQRSKEGIEMVRHMTERMHPETDSSLIVQKAADVFMEMQQAVDEVAGQVQHMRAATVEISAGIQEMKATSDHLSAMITKTASSSGQISQSVERQWASITAITNSSNKLSVMAQELQKLTSYFMVAEEPPSKT